MSTRPGVLHFGACALAALLVLQILWHAWLLPPAREQLLPILALAIVPLLPGLWTCLDNLRRGVLIGGIVSLFYFCHGVAEAWSSTGDRWLAALEIVVTLLLIGTLGVGVRRRG